MDEIKNKNEELYDSFFDASEDEESDYVIDPEHEQYLQDEFQDELIETIFYDIVEYIKHTGAPICEYLTLENLEKIINNILN